MRWLPLIAMGGCFEAPPVSEAPPAWDGPFLIDEVVIDCDGTRSWTYDVWTDGRGDAVTVDIVARQYGALVWNEHHEIREIAWDGATAHHQLVLDQVTDGADQVENDSTLFACEGKTYLTYGLASWRFDGALEGCVAWGVDPAGEFPDCADWGTNGH